ncbi:AAA family ATPase [Sphaerospermopsis sp. FACHB-1094]|uniref:AAA family ATPase n=1 Tax=Sphaerospermopsis sp. FACHB-1094 TaxID=2692861 RepID=UPI0018EFEC34|nr:AAA family ATPase [Sphaerospermopsis sp. FACHB-1094]
MNWTFPYCPDANNWTINWQALETEFDWLRSLAECPQDSRYHGEGNVLIHTKLVCEALVALPEWQTLPAKERSVLFAAALLHDVAKPAATQIETDGAISSKGHVLQGAKMAQQILWDLQVPFREREAVVALVKYGSLPLWFWDKPNPEKAVIKTSQIIRCDLLSLLAEADVRGRYCDDQTQLLERIAFFREFCQENQCFHQPRIFPSDHSRFIYFQKENGHPDYAAYDDTRLQVVMMSGLPGAGKDTWIQENLCDWPVISLDELRKTLKISPQEDQGAVINAAKALAKDYLRTGQSFVWNATNISRQLRSSLIRQFVNYQGKIRIVYLETSWEELLQRNCDRTAKLPEKVLYKLRNRLEVPDITEAQTVDWIVH